MTTRDFLSLQINHEPVTVRGADAFLTLSTYLRQKKQMTGTKVVCEEGDCGACTVLVGRVDGERLTYKPVNSCIQALCQLDGTHIVTVEGLRVDHHLHAVQEAMIQCHGAQCGYCTPGFVVAMCGMFEEKNSVSEQDIRDGLTGNLCRCTGYESIIKAGLTAASPTLKRMRELYPPAPIVTHLDELREIGVDLKTESRQFFAPTSLADASRIKAANPGALILQGGTDVGVAINKRGLTPETLLSLHLIEGLDELSIHGDRMTIGARVTLAQLEAVMEKLIPELHRILFLFGGPQIKNAGTLVGNIANGSPIGDTLPFLFVMGAELELTSATGSRTVAIENFYLGYKQLDLKADEIITRVFVPLPRPDETLKLYKVSRRRNLDISSFTAAFRAKVDDGRIGALRIAYGGVAPVIVRLPKTESFLTGKELKLSAFEAAGEMARSEIKPISDVRGSADFRYQLAENVLHKFYYDIAEAR